MFGGKIKVKDVVVFCLALALFLAKYFHLMDDTSNAFVGLLGFYVGHRTSGKDIG